MSFFFTTTNKFMGAATGGGGGTLEPGSGSASWTTNAIPYGQSDGTLDESAHFLFVQDGSNSRLKMSPETNGNNAIFTTGLVHATENLSFTNVQGSFRFGIGHGTFGDWEVSSGGHLNPSLNDNTHDIGTGSQDPRRLFLTQYVSMEEMTAPTGVSNKALLYAEDNGSGKTRLVVIFGSGAAQVIATEP